MPVEGYSTGLCAREDFVRRAQDIQQWGEDMATTNVQVVDARGSFCPGPLMELIRAVKAAEVGQVIAVLSNDSGSKRDIPFWAQKAGHEFIGVQGHDGYDEITVRKAH